jgi:hypothetical protein
MIEKGLIPFLLADAGVAALVGTRVYPNKVPQDVTTWPRIILHRISTTRPKSNQGRVGQVSARLQLECWGLTYLSAKTLAMAVLNARGPDGIAGPRLDGFKGRMGNVVVQSCFAEDEREDYFAPAFGDDVGAHRVMFDLVIWFEE